MNTEFKGTKETVHAEHRNGNQYFYFVNELKQKYFIGQMFYLKDDRQDKFTHNAELAVDAFNTIQSCGLLPSQLKKQNDEMRDKLKECVETIDWYMQNTNPVSGDVETFFNYGANVMSTSNDLIESTNP